MGCTTCGKNVGAKALSTTATPVRRSDQQTAIVTESGGAASVNQTATPYVRK